MNFMVYLKEKTLKDCNGIEGEIFGKIIEGNLSWIPNEQSSSIISKQ